MNLDHSTEFEAAGEHCQTAREFATFPQVDETTLGTATETRRIWGPRYFRLAIVLLTLNAISSLLFISLVNRPVFDDLNNFPDVHRYAVEGVSVDTIRRHINPTGPTSFIWMAAAVRILGSSGLRDARIAVLCSWLVLGAGVLIGASYSTSPQLWYAGFMVTLVFPLALTASATVLTEGPAMVFAILGSLAWIESLSRPVTPAVVLLGAVGGLSMGMAVTCRQYYLALLPAAAVLALYYWHGQKLERNRLWSMNVVFSLTVALIPILLLVLVWQGLSSPGMVSGRSYGVWVSKVGFNFLRPLTATFYTALYLVPLTFPAILQLRPLVRRRVFLFSAVVGGGVALCRSSILQPGPVQSVIDVAKRVAGGEFVIFWLIALVTIWNTLACGHLFWRRKDLLLSFPSANFAFLAVGFFIAEQVGIGGNVPFYELYVLQMAPFLGLIAFALLPRLTLPRLIVLASCSLVSHALLWRHALGR